MARRPQPKDRMRRVGEELMISKLIPDGPPLAMYDVGVGCYNEFRTLKGVWPSMALYGAEPDPNEHARVKDIFPGTLLQVALGTGPARQEMYIGGAGQGGSGFHYHGFSEAVTVDVMTLDAFDSAAGRPHRILLWLDVEDHELDVLASGPLLLASGRVWWANVETRDKADRPDAPCTASVNAALEQFGLVPVMRYNVQGSYPEAPGDMIYFRRGVKPLLQVNWGVQR